MPVFDFSDTPVANEHPECTYETFHSTETKASADKPIVVIDNKQKEWAHHALGMFTNPIKRTSFEFEDGDGVNSADILRSIQGEGGVSWQRHKAVCRGWIPAVYDGKALCQHHA